MNFYKLLNGYQIPDIGFGTWQITGEPLKIALRAAYDLGYINFDTAYIYGNEQEIGDFFRENEIDISKLIITTKLWNTEHGYDNTMRAFERSLKALGKVDVFLIHWPGFDRYVETWRAFEAIYRSGQVKAIGVSNFKKHHLETLIEQTEIVPMLNQIETNPYMYDNDTIGFCRDRGIAVQAWSPLAHGMELFSDEVLLKIAAKHDKSVAQVVLNYLQSKGLVVLPKSQTVKRIRENFHPADFSLDEDDMARIAGLNTGRRCGPDPDEFFGDS